MALICSCLCATLILLAFRGGYTQEGGQKPLKPEPGEPDLVITPHTIRVQPFDPDEKGSWIDLPGYSELGSPTFSRDAFWVAFDAYKEGYNNSRPECWVARRDGTGLKKLADGATPRWSPDGRRMLFIRGEENDPNQEPDIFLINRDGTGEQKIRPGRWPDWSPDGKRIAFSQGGSPGGGVKVGAVLYICEADGTGRREVIEGDCPSWSPDGKKIAYCYQEQDRPPLIQVVDLKTNEVETVGFGWFRANWMPDGGAVVANGPVGFGGLGMVRLPVGERQAPRQLFSEFEDPSSPCPSADGRYVTFIARRPKPDGGP